MHCLNFCFFTSYTETAGTSSVNDDQELNIVDEYYVMEKIICSIIIKIIVCVYIAYNFISDQG